MIWETFWRHDRSGKPGFGRVTEPPNKKSVQNWKPEKPEIIETGETGNRGFQSAAETVHNRTEPKVSCYMAASLLSLFPTYMTKRSPPEIWDVVVRLEVSVFTVQIGWIGASQISGGDSFATTGGLAPKAVKRSFFWCKFATFFCHQVGQIKSYRAVIFSRVANREI